MLINLPSNSTVETEQVEKPKVKSENVFLKDTGANSVTLFWCKHRPCIFSSELAGFCTAGFPLFTCADFAVCLNLVNVFNQANRLSTAINVLVFISVHLQPIWSYLIV